MSKKIEFESLPRYARLRQPHVLALTGWSAATLWRRVKSGQFPKPKKDGALTYWENGQVRDTLEGVQ